MTREKEVETMIQGINRFLFYNWNFESVAYDLNMHGDICRVIIPRAIIETEWNCGVDHMINKWLAVTKCNNADAYFPRFYAELSSDNRRALLTWIVSNYKEEQKI